jgi:AcrR family transcriptional regulator
MSDGLLTPERILDATEDVLRRFGPTKANVVDVARALGVSHGSVYRHFPSKVALRDAVIERWLARIQEPFVLLANEQEGSATDRLKRWLDLLLASKRARAISDPELFATYMEIAEEAREVCKQHVDYFVQMLTHIVSDGVAQGEFTSADPASTARAIFDATARFHNPAHASEWSDPGIDAAFEAVWSLILDGLSARNTHV